MAKTNKLSRREPVYGKLISKYAGNIKSPIAIVLTAHQGIPAAVFFEVAHLYGYKEQRIAELLDISVRTFKRYQQENKKLSPRNSEVLLKLMALFKQGLEIFGELEAFKRWLEKAAFGLGNHQPYELMKTSDGIDLVMQELVRIEYGDLA